MAGGAVLGARPLNLAAMEVALHDKLYTFLLYHRTWGSTILGSGQVGYEVLGVYAELERPRDGALEHRHNRDGALERLFESPACGLPRRRQSLDKMGKAGYNRPTN